MTTTFKGMFEALHEIRFLLWIAKLNKQDKFSKFSLCMCFVRVFWVLFFYGNSKKADKGIIEICNLYGCACVSYKCRDLESLSQSYKYRPAYSSLHKNKNLEVGHHKQTEIYQREVSKGKIQALLPFAFP